MDWPVGSAMHVAFFDGTRTRWPSGEKGAVITFWEISLLATLATSSTWKLGSSVVLYMWR